MNVHKHSKMYTQYQVDKMLDKAEADFEKQWNDKVEEIREKTFESVKLDMFSQFMSIAMATLEQNNGFDKEQNTKFYNDFVALLNLIKSKPLGKDVTTQDAINHVQSEVGIDLDSSLKADIANIN